MPDPESMMTVSPSSTFRRVTFPAMGAVNTVWIADALSGGIDGVLLIGCKHGDDYQCHYIRGSERPYEDAGYDQIRLDFIETWGLLQLLGEVPGVAWASRDLVERLLRKGRSMQARWHNYLLADDVFAEVNRLSESGES